MVELGAVVRDLERDEGFRPKLYRDSLNYLTIGFGFMVDPDHPGSIEMPRQVGELWMRLILRDRIDELNVVIPWWKDLTETRKTALLNMAYQLGTGGLLKFRKMLRALEEKDYVTARREALDSRWAQQTPRRAQRIADMLGPDG